MTVWCDGKAAVNAASKYNDIAGPEVKQNDLINNIRAMIRQSRIDWAFKHVKGHTCIRPFTRETALNDAMDVQCKEFLQEQEPIPHAEAPLTYEIVTIWREERKIVGNLSKELLEMIQNRAGEEYWKEKLSLPEGTRIDWVGFEKAIKGLPRARRHWLAKQSSGMCTSGRMMKAMGMRETDECPRCGESEDSTHLWQCSDQGTEIAWYRWQRELEVWWRNSDTNPALGDAIIQAVELWRIGDPGTAGSTCPRIEAAILHQHRIGWRAFLEGKWAPEWRELYVEMGGSKRDVTWAKTVIEIGWRTGWAIWEERNDLIHRKESEVANQMMNARINRTEGDAVEVPAE
jgi:hypothetical protein